MMQCDINLDARLPILGWFPAMESAALNTAIHISCWTPGKALCFPSFACQYVVFYSVLH